MLFHRIVADELSSPAFAHFIGPRRMNSIILIAQEAPLHQLKQLSFLYTR